MKLEKKAKWLKDLLIKATVAMETDCKIKSNNSIMFLFEITNNLLIFRNENLIKSNNEQRA
jgi:hypothetical protein